MLGGKRPNGFGLHDMLGNVAEFCEDDFDIDFYSAPEASGLDPICRNRSTERVLRGGSFWRPGADTEYADAYRSTCRDEQEEDVAFRTQGLRAAYWPVP